MWRLAGSSSSRYRLIKYGPEIILGLLIIVTSLLNVVWVHRDTLLGPEADFKYYFISTYKFIDGLSSGSWSEIPRALSDLSLEGRPPLYQLLSIPFLLVFGRSMDSAVLVNLPFQFLLLISVYWTGKLLADRGTGLLAAALVSAYPPLIQLAHIFRPHFALAACVSLCIWRSLLLLEIRSTRNVWLFVLSALFGVLVHPFIVFVLALPVLFASIYIILFQTEPRWPPSRSFRQWLSLKLRDPVFVYGFLPVFICAMILISAWYLIAGIQLFKALQTIDLQALAEFRGYDVFTRGLGYETGSYFWWYLVTMPNAISNVLVVYFGIGVVYGLVSRKPPGLVLLLVFLGAYLLLASLSTMTWMHFAQVLPVVSVISVLWIREVGNKWLRLFFTGFLISASVFVYSVVMWGIGSDWDRSAAVALGSPLSSSGNCRTADQVFCPRPPSTQDWKSSVERLIGAVLGDPACKRNGCDLFVVPHSAQFADYDFGYYLTTDFPNASLPVHGVPDKGFTLTPFDFDALLNSQYIVYANIDFRGDSYTAALARLLHAPPASFSGSHTFVKSLRLPDGSRVRLIKRVSPLTLEEAEDVIRSIDLAEKYKFQQYQVLAPLYAKAHQPDEALAAYKRALIYASAPDAGLHFGLASAYASLGQNEPAALEYQKVIEIDPNSDWATQAREWLSKH